MELFLFHHEIVESPVIAALLSFRETGEESDYYTAARGLLDYGTVRLTGGNIIKEYILRKMLESPNIRQIDKLRDFLREDVRKIYHELLEPDWDGLCKEKGFLPLSGIPVTAENPYEDAGYVRSLEMMTECTSNEALVGALLAHAEAF